MEKDANYYYEGGKSLKVRINTLVNSMLFLEGVINDPERPAGARKDAQKEYNFLRNHNNTIIEHYTRLEKEVPSEYLESFQEGFRFDQ